MRAPAVLAMAMLSLVACTSNAPLPGDQPTFHAFQPDAAAPARRDSVARVDPDRVPPEVTPSRGVALRTAPPAFAPAVTAPATPSPGSTTSQPLASGPITGYGQGGMQHEPGMPHNPPWN